MIRNMRGMIAKSKIGKLIAKVFSVEHIVPLFHYSKPLAIGWIIVISFLFLVPIIVGSMIEGTIGGIGSIIGGIIGLIMSSFSILIVNQTIEYFSNLSNIINKLDIPEEIKKNLVISIEHITRNDNGNQKMYYLHGVLNLSKIPNLDENFKSFRFFRTPYDYADIYKDNDNNVINLLEKQLEDFRLINKSISKSWYTIAYMDIPVILQQPEYIVDNIKKIRRNSGNLDMRRLIVFPPRDPQNRRIKQEFLDELKKKKINLQDNLERYISFDDQEPYVSDDAPEIIKYIIYFLWLVRIHREFGIDYRIVKSFTRRDNIVGNLLDNWQAEGGAVIDNAIKVTFSTKEDNTIVYKFERERRSIINFSETFERLWGPGFPQTYTYDNLESFLHEVFRNFEGKDNIVKNLMNFVENSESTVRWIDLIKNEL